MMQAFIKHTGLVAPMDRVNVDTDQIVPKQFLKWLTREGYGRVLFYDWRYQEGEVPNTAFALNQPRYEGVSILLGRANFGCGSSREQAPWALLDYGFCVLIASSFADIFYNNCFKNGILPITLPDAEVEELFRRTAKNEGYSLTVDLESQIISEASKTGEPPLKISFKVDPFRRECLLKGLDDIGLTLRFEERISTYEKQHQPDARMHGPLTSSASKPNN
jgi:3-isopropylmalate/(R)-2-methylmalate dehydratase small subunit